VSVFFVVVLFVYGGFVPGDVGGLSYGLEFFVDAIIFVVVAVFVVVADAVVAAAAAAAAGRGWRWRRRRFSIFFAHRHVDIHEVALKLVTYSCSYFIQ